VLTLTGVSRQYGSARAVDEVSVAIEPGSFVGIIGRSGAGKSTLLRLVNRLIDPSAGTIRFGETNVTALQGRELRLWRRRCAMIFQQFNLAGRLDVLTNVMLGRIAHMPPWRAMTRLWPREDRLLALAALERLDVAGLAAKRADQLSGGQQQRVAIARALVQEPDLILADEPVASLDPRNTRVVMDELRRINRQFGITVLCNLHHLDLVQGYCDRVIGMAQGRVVFDGLPAALTEQVAHDLYGLEAAEVLGPGAPAAADLVPGFAPQPA
jgi:phosphonate transport system ATP-binding protein